MIKNVKKKFVKPLVIVCIALLAISMVPTETQAAVSKVVKPVLVDNLISSNGLKHDFVQISADGNQLHVTCETTIRADRFGLSVRRVKPSSSCSEWKSWMQPENQGSFDAFSGDLSAEGLNGDYVLLITMYRNGAMKSEVFYKNANFRVVNGKFSLLQFNTILNANKAMVVKGAKYKRSRFTDKALGDVKSLLFRDPKSGKVASVTKKKTDYFKTVSKAVTKGAGTDYQKVRKIYEYIAENFYYDDVAFASKKNQYLDPYRNLYNLRNKKKSANSMSNGKVATVCVGNAGMVTALARAQGIPARIVNGHHVGLSAEKYYNWSNEPNISKVDHWWAEVYVNGRWIVVDPTPGNGNRWNSKTNQWTRTGLTNYVYFDPTIEQLSTSHVTYEIRT